MSEFNLCKSFNHSNKASFVVDAVLFDMDGTLVDSIAAVESAWGAVAVSLGRDRQEVIDATHGRRAIDNLKDLKPHLRRMSNVEMDPHVTEFETEILRHADEYSNEVRSRRSSAASSKRQSREASRAPSRAGSMSASMAEKMDKATSAPRRKSSLSQSISADALTNRMAAVGLKPLTRTESPNSDAKSPSPADSGVDLSMDKKLEAQTSSATVEEDPFADDDDDSEVNTDDSDIEIDTSDLTDKSVRILPGVRRMIDALPEGRYAVATSGAKTYCYGALKRVGITPPPVTITADDPRLKNGKPFPDPFILAAECLGYKPENCLVVEDSPSGIKAGVASGAKVIAVCTSHPHEKIGHCGAHWLIPTLDLVKVKVLPDKRIEISIDATHEEVASAHSEAIKSNAPPQLIKELEGQQPVEATA